MGAWLSVLPSVVNRKELGAQEWRDSLFLKYVIESPDLPYHCDGCGSAFSIFHALDCKTGGLVTARHNELHGGVSNLSGKAFTPMHMYDDPKLFTVRAVRGGKNKAKGKGKGAPPLDYGVEKGKY